MGKMIELTASDGHKLAAYRADPAGKPRGTIVVIQEIFGVNSHIKSVADGTFHESTVDEVESAFDDGRQTPCVASLAVFTNGSASRA